MADDLALRTALAELGGVARSADLLRTVDNRAIRDALDTGTLIRLSRGRYAGAGVALDLQRAYQAGGVVSHLSAAAHHGWSLKRPPLRPHVTVGRHRHLRPSAAKGLSLHWRPVPPELVVDGVTEPYRTVLDCASDLPFDEALTVADSALRCGHIEVGALRDLAAVSSGPGSVSIRRVAKECTIESANPLESVMRAISCSVPGLVLVPQFQIEEPYARVDLCDARLRIVVETEGFETHATRAGFDKDCARYTALTAGGYLVLRFTYQQVMHDPQWVTTQLERTAVLVRARDARAPSGRKVAQKAG